MARRAWQVALHVHPWYESGGHSCACSRVEQRWLAGLIRRIVDRSRPPYMIINRYVVPLLARVFPAGMLRPGLSRFVNWSWPLIS